MSQLLILISEFYLLPNNSETLPFTECIHGIPFSRVCITDYPKTAIGKIFKSDRLEFISSILRLIYFDQSHAQFNKYLSTY